MIACFLIGTTSNVMFSKWLFLHIWHLTCSVTSPTFPPCMCVTERGVSLGWVFNPHLCTASGLMKFPADPESSIIFTRTASLIHTLVKNCFVMAYGVSQTPISMLASEDTFAFGLAATAGNPSFLTAHSQNPNLNPCSCRELFPFLM